MANRKAYNFLRAWVHLGDEQRDIVVGTLLGDGSLVETFSRNNLRLQVAQCDAQKSYVLWKYEALKSFVLTPPKYQSINNSWHFRTISHPEFTELGRIFYRDRTKIVPKDIASFLSPIGLAVWFMDDGANHGSGYLLNTQSFTRAECEHLCKALNDRFGIAHTTLHKDHGKWRIYIRSASRKRFCEIVIPLISPEMMYKLKNPVETTREPPIAIGVKI